MTAPVYRIASVWAAVKLARATGHALVVFSAEEEVAAAAAIKSIRTCECGAAALRHVHADGKAR